MAHSIVFIAPYKRLAELFQEVCREFGKNIPVITGELEDGADIARDFQEKGVDVIISRGGTALAIRERIKDIPIVEVPISVMDLLRAVNIAMAESDKIIIAGFKQFTYGLEGLEEILNINTRILILDEETLGRSAENIESLRKYMSEGFEMLVGDTTAVGLAEPLGFKTVLIRSGKNALIQAISEAEKMAVVRRVDMEKARRFQCVTGFAHEGIVCVDSDGTVSLFNPSAQKILDIPGHRVVGKKIDQVLPGFALANYFGGTTCEFDKAFVVRERKISANIVPIRIDGETIRVVATFLPVSKNRNFYEEDGPNRKGLIAENTFDDIIGESGCIAGLKAEANEYAGINSPLFLYGETGTGKELFAQAVHNAGPRRSMPFVAFNCAALPENLLESELFGYTEGAFTGASRCGKPGLFELARGGTIFLDEIGEISANTQVRLLRVLQEKKVRRVGDDKLTSVDVRVIVASHDNLIELVAADRFREDLFYRINVLNLVIPPLRERREDIPLLLDFFLRKYVGDFRKAVDGFSREAVKILTAYSWPGNVRQLENIVERLVIKSKERIIAADLVREAMKAEPCFHEPAEERKGSPDAVLAVPLDLDLAGMQRHIIGTLMKRARGNKQEVADRLRIGRTTLWRKLKS